MVKIKTNLIIDVFILFLISNLVISSGYKNKNYSSFTLVSIYNIQGNCRYCKSWINSSTIGFDQCFLTFSPIQRTNIVKADNSCANYSFINVLDFNQYLKNGLSKNFEIISVNNDGGLAIRDPLTNKCMTNNLLDNMVYPFGLTDNQLFTSCLPYNTDESQVFYFNPHLMTVTNTLNCRTETSINVQFEIFETLNSVLIYTKYAISDNTDIILSGPFVYSYNVGNNLSVNTFNLWIEPGLYEVDLTLKNPSLYSFTKYTINVSNLTTIEQIKVTEIIQTSVVTLKFYNTVKSEFVSSGFLEDNSDIAISNVYLNVGTLNFFNSDFILPIGSHSITITLKYPLVVQFNGPFSINVANTNPIELILNFSTTIFDFYSDGKVYMDLPSGNTSMNAKPSWWGCCSDIITTWSKVQVFPHNLSDIWIKLDDYTFSSSVGELHDHHGGISTKQAFAAASDCEAFNSMNATSYINFNGIPFQFKISAETKIYPKGWYPNGTTTINPDRKSAVLTGGGYCGGNYPDSIAGMPNIVDGILEYVGP